MSAVYSDLFALSQQSALCQQSIQICQSVLCQQSVEICTVSSLLRSVLCHSVLLAVYSDLSVCTMSAVY